MKNNNKKSRWMKYGFGEENESGKSENLFVAMKHLGIHHECFKKMLS